MVHFLAPRVGWRCAVDGGWGRHAEDTGGTSERHRQIHV